MDKSPCSLLPRPVVNEIVRQYSDVLRVGSLTVNGEVLRWDTSATGEELLKGFCEVFFAKLQTLEELQGLDEAILHQAAYWLCKAVSINYALVEVLNLLRSKVGRACSIQSSKNGGHGGNSLVHYMVEVLPERVLKASIVWESEGNVISCDPGTASRRVSGTVSSLATEFNLPPDETFMPAYSLQMSLKRSCAGQLARRLNCCECRENDASTSEVFLVEDPLRSNSTVLERALSSRSPRASPRSGSLCLCDPSTPVPAEMELRVSQEVSPPPLSLDMFRLQPLTKLRDQVAERETGATNAPGEMSAQAEREENQRCMQAERKECGIDTQVRDNDPAERDDSFELTQGSPMHLDSSKWCICMCDAK